MRRLDPHQTNNSFQPTQLDGSPDVPPITAYERDDLSRGELIELNQRRMRGILYAPNGEPMND